MNLDDREYEVVRGNIVLCACERGSYNIKRHQSCYECFLDRAAEFATCVWCGRWHSHRFSTCFACRVQVGREEAAAWLRFDVMIRDEARCQDCRGDGAVQVDHVQPCAEGGNAQRWNLQLLCAGCNRAKGRTWYVGSAYWRRRIELMRHYLTTGWRWLSDDEREALRVEAELEGAGLFRGCTRMDRDYDNPDHHWADDLADGEPVDTSDLVPPPRVGETSPEGSHP